MVFGLLLGIMNTYGVAIGLIAANYDYSENAASLFGAVFITGGIIGAGVFGGIVETKKNYKTIVFVIGAFSAILPIGLIFGFLDGSVWMPTVGCLLVGFVLIPILPVGIDFGVEITHPIPESISSGLLMSGG